MEHDIAIDIDTHSLTLEEVLDRAKVDVTRFPAAGREDTSDHLEKAGLAVGSLLSNLLKKSDGVLLDNSWFRIFGVTDRACGRSLYSWNQSSSWKESWGNEAPGMLVFADDPFGNQFGINLGIDGTGNWKVFLGSRQSESWNSLDITFGQWLEMVLEESSSKFYEGLPLKVWKSIHQENRTPADKFIRARADEGDLEWSLDTSCEVVAVSEFV